jgi:acyl-coenzyme A synthetase/AMP-(fatty) acid ligase/thioesterase domain-containing protein
MLTADFARAWDEADLGAVLRRLHDADAAAPMVADGIAPTPLDRDTVWQLACGFTHAVAQAPSGTLGMLLPEGAEAQAWIAGALMTDRTFALLDWKDPPERTAAIAEAIGLAACIAEPSAVLPDGVPRLQAPIRRQTPVLGRVHPDAPALIVPTSGSTGRPKGIVHSRRTLLFRVHQLIGEFDFGRRNTYLSTAANSSISGIIHGMGGMLSGALLLRVDVARLGLRAVLDAAERHQADTMQGLAATLCTLLTTPGAERALARVVRCQVSGTAMLAADLEILRNALPAGCHLVNLYGLTELPALLRWEVPADWSPDGARIPAGKPLAGHEVTLLDLDGQPVPQGETGELVATSRFIALGEWQDGGLVSAGRISACQDRPGFRRLSTGDLARWRPDGLLEIVGRADRQVKIAGRRVELEEIEHQLRLQPGIREAAVVVDRHGPGGPRIHAAVVPDASATDDPAEAVGRSLRATLPGYMQPARIVALSRLPRLPGGKVDNAALLQEVQTQRLPEPRGSSLAATQLRPAWRRALHDAVPEPGLGVSAAGGESQRLLFLPGLGGDSESLARLRDDCPNLDIVVAHYANWRSMVRGGASVANEAALLLPQLEAAFPGDSEPMLLGYSYGGAVAWELAALLARRNRTVRHVMLLDSVACIHEAPSPPPADVPGTAPATASGSTARRWLRWRMRIAGGRSISAWLLASLLPDGLPGEFGPRLSYELEVNVRMGALRRWPQQERPHVPVPATLFVSQAPRADLPEDLGWGSLLDLQKILHVGGDHYSMLLPPHRGQLATLLQQEVLASPCEQPARARTMRGAHLIRS